MGSFIADIFPQTTMCGIGREHFEPIVREERNIFIMIMNSLLKQRAIFVPNVQTFMKMVLKRCSMDLRSVGV